MREMPVIKIFMRFLQEAKTSELSVHHDVNRGYESPQQDDVSLQVQRRGPERTHLPNPLV